MDVIIENNEILNIEASFNITSLTFEMTIGGGGGGVADHKVSYNVDDDTPGYIADKFLAGDNIVLTEGTGTDENKLEISVASSPTFNTVDLSNGLVSLDWNVEDKTLNIRHVT